VLRIAAPILDRQHGEHEAPAFWNALEIGVSFLPPRIELGWVRVNRPELLMEMAVNR